MWLIELVFPSILQIWYVENMDISKYFRVPLEFGISRVDCIYLFSDYSLYPGLIP